MSLASGPPWPPSPTSRVASNGCCGGSSGPSAVVVGWHVSVSWQAELPAMTTARRGSGYLVACAPHRTWLEPFLLLAAWPEDAARLAWLADGPTVTRSWWRRRLLPRLGILPIERRVGGPGAYLEAGASALAAGAALVVFPEKGPPSPADRTRAISPGFAYLARRAGAPVVPVVVAGSHAVMRGSHFSVTFLEALPAGGSGPRGPVGHLPAAGACPGRACRGDTREGAPRSATRRPTRSSPRWRAGAGWAASSTDRQPAGPAAGASTGSGPTWPGPP